MANRSFSAYFGAPGNFEEPTPAWDEWAALFGDTGAGGVATLAAAVVQNNLSPVVIALVVPDELDLIHFVHSPTVHHGPGHFNERVIALRGDLEDECVPELLHETFFRRAAAKPVLTDPDASYQVLAAGANVVPPSVAGAPGVEEIRSRRFMVLPSEWAVLAVSAGLMSQQEFYETFLQATIDAAVAADVAALAPWTQWWKCSCTDQAVAGGADERGPDMTFLDQGTMAQHCYLKGWASRRICAAALVNVAPPLAAGALTNATVTTAMDRINGTLDDHERARVTRLVGLEHRSFTAKFGDVMATAVQLVLLVDNDAAMPEIHQALARNKESSHEAIILEGALLRVQADSVLPVTDGNRVKVTRHLVDIFRRHNIYAEESVLGEGLSPFSMVCQGHPNAADSKRLLDDSALVERGASLTLQDARAMAVSDARIPQFLQHVTDKLYAHSHCWNLYAGNRHILATAIAIATLALGPVIMNLANYFGSPALALRMALRIVFKFQQLTFRWVRRRRDTPRGTVVPVPDYMDMVYDVQSFLFHGMPELPVAWNNLICDENDRGQERQPERIRGGAGGGGTGAEAQATIYNTPTLTPTSSMCRHIASNTTASPWTGGTPHALGSCPGVPRPSRDRT